MVSMIHCNYTSSVKVACYEQVSNEVFVLCFAKL